MLVMSESVGKHVRFQLGMGVRFGHWGVVSDQTAHPSSVLLTKPYTLTRSTQRIVLGSATKYFALKWIGQSDILYLRRYTLVKLTTYISAETIFYGIW